MCYFVCFAHSTAAQQAVQYLNGAKLKNYKIIITSTVYEQKDVTNDEDEKLNLQDGMVNDKIDAAEQRGQSKDE